MTRRKKRTKKRSSKSAKKGSFFGLKALFGLLVVSFAVLISAYFSYKAGYEKGYSAAAKSAQKKIASIKREEKEALKKHLREHLSEIKDYMQNKAEETKPAKIEQKVYHSKPKLAIIIDDVAFGAQVKKLKSLGFAVNPSFFPPTPRHPNTPDLAREFDFYMVHLPLEAVNFSTPEKDTLTTASSLEEIRERIKNIKEWFPRVKYLNNHTGSAFTSDLVSMRKLMRVLKEEGLFFVDSRTTPNTKVPAVMKEIGNRYIARDIFLDNEPDEGYIKNQLKKAVKIAKKRGYAVAIGHPHPKTIEALRNSKDILKEVELVYINQL